MVQRICQRFKERQIKRHQLFKKCFYQVVYVFVFHWMLNAFCPVFGLNNEKGKKKKKNKQTDKKKKKKKIPRPCECNRHMAGRGKKKKKKAYGFLGMKSQHFPPDTENQHFLGRSFPNSQGATLAKHVAIRKQKKRGKGYGFHTGCTDKWTSIRVSKSEKWTKKGKKSAFRVHF